MGTEIANSKAEPLHYANWRKIIQGYEASGLSQLEYCARESHSFRKFKYYRSRFFQLTKNKTDSFGKNASFAPVILPMSVPLGLRIELGNGAYCIMQSPRDAVLVKALLSGSR